MSSEPAELTPEVLRLYAQQLAGLPLDEADAATVCQILHSISEEMAALRKMSAAGREPALSHDPSLP